jgi:putative hemin transport protein
MSTTSNTTATTLSERWKDLQQNNPKLRIRNAAAELGVSEAELLATQVGNTVQTLRPEFQNILSEIESLGKVMALTRNDDVVHERKGVYLGAELKSPHVGLFVSADIDLRIFFSVWKYAFAVTEGDDKPRHSIQFFAKDGEAIHKIYLVPDSNVEAFQALVTKYLSETQSQELDVEPAQPKQKEVVIENFDPTEFRAGWLEMKDTHEFFGLVKKFGLGRVQALQSAPDAHHAHQIKNDAMTYLLNEVSARDLEIMVFVGNKGMIQIHTGPAKKIVAMDEWLNILDPDFNLHIKTASAYQTWVVRKPTEDGIVTSIEVFNDMDEMIVQFFGKRKPGIPERTDWQQLVADLEKQFSM